MTSVESIDLLTLACELIRRKSVTPDDAGCQSLMIDHLKPLGFAIEHLPFAEVENFWARRGTADPLVVFAGHTDVVPTGPLEEWSSPPFEPEIRGPNLYGRGAADMKSSLAAMMVAVSRFLQTQQSHNGSIGFLVTSDEEGNAKNGTAKVVEHLSRSGTNIHYCIVGEPSSHLRIGDVIRVGRRGSLNARLTVSGIQGHVAYPNDALNPIHHTLCALDALTRHIWDEGNDVFPPTSLQISNIHAGTSATNVIPGKLEVDFNIRFNTEQTIDGLTSAVEKILAGIGIPYNIDWVVSGEPFETKGTHFPEVVMAAVQDVTGEKVEMSTSGGTSDGRFIAPTGAEVVELGPVNASIHKIDEYIATDDLEPLAQMYERILYRLLVRN
jgi:succinyl-diaminopimelate desuccinylase